MGLPEDIIAKIHRDFSRVDAELVERRLSVLSKDEPDLFCERILRCIVFASAGRLASIDLYVTMTHNDPRDVMVAGECDNDWKRVRDFNRPFRNVA